MKALPYQPCPRLRTQRTQGSALAVRATHASSMRGNHSCEATHFYPAPGASPAVGSTIRRDIELVTQVSLDRWPRFAQQALAWRGPASVAVYIPCPPDHPLAPHYLAYLQPLARQLDAALTEAVLGADSAAAAAPAAPAAPAPAGLGTALATASPPAPPPPLLIVSILHAHHVAVEGAGVLRARLGVSLEASSNSTTSTSTSTSGGSGGSTASPDVYEQLYPINALRNAALAHARSSHVFLVDGDFMPSAGLRTHLLLGAAPGSGRASSGGAGSGGGGGGGGGVARSSPPSPLDASDAAVHPVMWVVPAFELAAPAATAIATAAGGEGGGNVSAAVGEVPDEQMADVPRTLDQLLSYDRGEPQPGGSTVVGGAPGRPVLRPFHCGRYPQPRPSVDYAGWLQEAAAAQQEQQGQQQQQEQHQQQGKDQQPTQAQAGAEEDGWVLWREVPYHEYFEPYGIVRRDQVPWYDERFRGYGLNKVQHAYHMAAAGFQFRLLRRHFCVTVPHKRSASYRAAFGTAADPQQRLRVEQLYGRFKTEMRQMYGYEYGSAHSS